MTDAEELVLVDAALESLYKGGQAVSVLGRSFTRADLKDLIARKDTLQARVRRASRGGIPLQRMVSNE